MLEIYIILEAVNPILLDLTRVFQANIIICISELSFLILNKLNFIKTSFNPYQLLSVLCRSPLVTSILLILSIVVLLSWKYMWRQDVFTRVVNFEIGSPVPFYNQRSHLQGVFSALIDHCMRSAIKS